MIMFPEIVHISEKGTSLLLCPGNIGNRSENNANSSILIYANINYCNIGCEQPRRRQGDMHGFQLLLQDAVPVGFMLKLLAPSPPVWGPAYCGSWFQTGHMCLTNSIQLCLARACCYDYCTKKRPTHGPPMANKQQAAIPSLAG